MTLFYTDRRRDAARYLLAETCLDRHVYLRGRTADDGTCLTITGNLDVLSNWSSGEVVLVDLLYALAEQRTFDLTGLMRGKADAASTTAAVLAIGMACGVVVPPVALAGESL